MKAFARRRRLLVAVLVAAVAAGFAGGIVLASGGTAAAGRPGVLARGTFHTVTWGTTGTAIIERDSAGKLVLRFDHRFSTRSAPDLYVYLDQRDPRTNHGNRGKSLLVGSLGNSVGGQHYSLPASAASMTGYVVEVYCAECDKTNGLAQLTPSKS